MGECHYQVGNYDAIVTAGAVRRILVHAGINPERYVLDWASAAEAPLYVKLITGFTDKIKDLGPLNQGEHSIQKKIPYGLSVAKAAVQSVRLRTRLAKTVQDMRINDDYSFNAVESKIAEKLDAVITREMERTESAMKKALRDKNQETAGGAP